MPYRIDQAYRDAQDAFLHEKYRIETQIAFARGLLRLHSGEKEAWDGLLKQAEERVVPAFAERKYEALRDAVREAEGILAPIGEVAKTYTIYCVGHAHIDMNWMWSWPETVSLTVDTMRTVLALLEEFPDFQFAQSQASVYAILEEFAPELLDPIRARIAEGRWMVSASHWVENEKNYVSGESLARHLLYTRRYLEDLLGVAPEDAPLDWAPDTFGHAATVPSYLARGGVRWYYCCRPGVDGPARPPVFRWEGPDGARVLVRNDRYFYNKPLMPDIWPRLVDFAAETGLRYSMNVFGVGDHGGGPTRRDLLYGREMAGWPVFPALVFSTPKPFFERLEEEGERVPVFRGELNREFTGCYTSAARLKKANRHSEDRLWDAETAAALAQRAVGSPYPGEVFRDCWRETLFNHFHDILPGSGVHDTLTFSHGKYQHVMAHASNAETNALRALAARIDTSAPDLPLPPERPASRVRSAFGGGIGTIGELGELSSYEQGGGEGPRPFLVFNSAQHARAGVAEVTVWEKHPLQGNSGPHPGVEVEIAERPFLVRTPTGRVVPAQQIGSGRYWAHDYVRLSFPVEEIPGLGYGIYTVYEGDLEEEPPRDAVRFAGRYGMENDRIRLLLDPATGGIRSLAVKDGEAWTEVLDTSRAPAGLEYAVERPHRASSWVIEEMERVEQPRFLGIDRDPNGPWAKGFRIRFAVGNSTLEAVYSLRAGEEFFRLDIDAKWIEWGDEERGVPTLRLSLPLALETPTLRCETPFGAIERGEPEFGEITGFGPMISYLACNDAVPAHRWAEAVGPVGGRQIGCWLGADCKHGFALRDGVLRLALIRSTYEPDQLPEVAPHRIRLGLAPVAGASTTAAGAARATELTHVLRTMGTTLHEGPLPRSASLLGIGPENAVLSGVKCDEDGDGLIVRLYETEGRETVAEIVPDAILGRLAAVEACDLMERTLASGESGGEVKDGAARVTLPAFGLATVRLRFA